jgi:hypothetical protein
MPLANMTIPRMTVAREESIGFFVYGVGPMPWSRGEALTQHDSELIAGRHPFPGAMAETG